MTVNHHQRKEPTMPAANGMSQKAKIVDALERASTKEKREFTAAELAVLAWRLYPGEFGLEGFDDKYPDCNKVWAALMGDAGLVQQRHVDKCGNKRYRLGPRRHRELEERDAVTKAAPAIAPATVDFILDHFEATTAAQVMSGRIKGADKATLTYTALLDVLRVFDPGAAGRPRAALAAAREYFNGRLASATAEEETRRLRFAQNTVSYLADAHERRIVSTEAMAATAEGLARVLAVEALGEEPKSKSKGRRKRVNA